MRPRSIAKHRAAVTWTVDIIEVGTLPDTALGAYVYGALDEAVLDVPCFCWLLRDGQRSCSSTAVPTWSSP